MNTRAAHRIRQQSLGRRALGLFAAVWLNLALQPCAMALEADHDCPHCPPAHEHAMAAHHGHGEAKQQAPCASLQTQCGELEDASVDGRTGQLKIKDGGDMPLAIVSGLPQANPGHIRVASRSTGPPVPAGTSPPLHVLNCVYLK